MRLIDAEKAEQKFVQMAESVNPIYRECILTMALYLRNEDDIPTVDAVPVVRCRDCVYGVDYYHDGECYCSNPKWGLMYFGGYWSFYCADAERKKDDTN